MTFCEKASPILGWRAHLISLLVGMYVCACLVFFRGWKPGLNVRDFLQVPINYFFLILHVYSLLWRDTCHCTSVENNLQKPVLSFSHGALGIELTLSILVTSTLTC